MKTHAALASILAVALGLGSAAAAVVEVLPHRQDVVPNPPRSPAEALEKMTVPEGFTVELVASEPDLVNPIAMTFDERGRIWVTESLEYPRKEPGPGRDRVKILEDTNGDGRADRFTIFADDLNIPTGIAVGHGGVWVLNAPDLLFFGERGGKMTRREVVLTGFGRADTHELPSSLTWGPDGWLYGLNGVFNPSRILSRGKEFRFTCAMYRIHPRTREFQVMAEGTSNPYGIAWDTEGSAIVEACHWAKDHLFHFVETGYYQRQAGAYPPYTMRLGSITDHGHQKTAYCGIAFFDSDAYPENYRERIMVGNIHGGCINVDRLERDGATYLARAEPDFLNANDAWFMPVAQKVGPDGCLYILDWYDRYHCYQDANRDPEGIDRLKGRLYRVRYRGTPRAPKFDLARETDDQLVARLADPNIYFRETAQRLLSERAGDTLAGKLERLVLDRTAPRKARRHGLWALIGSGRLRPAIHEVLLDDPDPAFRAWGVRAAGDFGSVPAPLRDRVAGLARDPSPDVQLQVAIAARKLEGLDALAVLVEVLKQCGHDKLVPYIVWPNLHPLLENDSARFVELIQGTGGAPAVRLIAPRAVERMLGALRIEGRSVALLIDDLAKRDPARAREGLSMIAAKIPELDAAGQDELRRGLGPWLAKTSADPAGNPLHDSALLLAARMQTAAVPPDAVRRRFLGADQPEQIRLDALSALVAFRDRDLLAGLPQLLTTSPPAFAAKALPILGRWDEPRLGDLLLELYGQLDPQVQSLAVEVIMQREPWARKLLRAVQDGKLPKQVLHANHLRKILETNDREAIWAVEKTWGLVREERNPDREKVVAEMAEYLGEHMGDPVAGEKVFEKLCAQCHTLHGRGGQVGPDITGNGRASFEQLLSNIFDPSLVIGPAYQVTTVVTKDGRNLTGLITEENDQRIVLKLPGEGQETVPRNLVKYTRTSKLSMMPEGLETLVERRELSDLLAFLAFDRHPGDPQARLIPGAPPVRVRAPDRKASTSGRARVRLERRNGSLRVLVYRPSSDDAVELAVYEARPGQRPYLHPVHHPASRVVLTENRPADHPWQHGIFTGFHRVNGLNYWKEDQGRQRLVRLFDSAETGERIRWSALIEWVNPSGVVVADETDTITFYAPEHDEDYRIDYQITLRANEKEIVFGQFAVGGLAVRMPWDPQNPRHRHLNSERQRDRQCEQQRARWCLVERPFGAETFGFAILDHPQNPNHPTGWRVDEQGLINPAVSMLGDWTLAPGAARSFQYRIIVYRRPASAERIQRHFDDYARAQRKSRWGEAPAEP